MPETPHRTPATKTTADQVTGLARKPPTKTPPAGYVGMADAQRITGLTRETITKDAGKGKIPGAIRKPGSKTAPWWFTIDGLRRYIGITDDAEAAS